MTPLMECQGRHAPVTIMHGENPAEINTATETFEDRDVFHDVVSRPGPRTISTI